MTLSGREVVEFGLVRNVAGHAPPKPEQVAAAERYLSDGYIPAKATKYDSYALKHRAERATIGYVSNGALIQAAPNLGLRVEACDWRGPNCWVFVKRPKGWRPTRCRDVRTGYEVGETR